MTNWRTTLLAILAGLSFIVAALQGSGPMTVRDWALAVAGALVAALGVFAKDAEKKLPPATSTPVTHGAPRNVEPEPSAAWGPRPSEE